MALMAAHHSTLVAAERAEDVLLGGPLGFLAFAAVRAIGLRLFPERAPKPSEAMER